MRATATPGATPEAAGRRARLRRYQVVHSTTPAGGYTEFSAPDDAAALAHASRFPYQGGVVFLAEVIGATEQRRVPLP